MCVCCAQRLYCLLTTSTFMPSLVRTGVLQILHKTDLEQCRLLCILTVSNRQGTLFNGFSRFSWIQQECDGLETVQDGCGAVHAAMHTDCVKQAGNHFKVLFLSETVLLSTTGV